MNRRQALLIAVAVLLATPSLTVGYVADDHVQRLLATDVHVDGISAHPGDVFAFASGDAAESTRKIRAGVFPWWADPELKLAFFRPLASATHTLDAVAWPDSPWLAHLENLAWFALALVAVAAWYRDLLPACATLALGLYAVDDAHGPAVGWIANRNAMMCVALGVPAAVAWRRRRPWLAGALLFVALMAGEAALGALALVVADVVHLDDRPWRARARDLAVLALPVVAWAGLSRGLGYGVARSGVYIDPTDPARFAGAVLERLPFLLVAQAGGAWSELPQGLLMFAPEWRWPVVWINWAALGLLAALLLPWLRRDRVARAGATAAVLAAVPICGAFAADRLLWFVGIGAMGLVARGVSVATARWGRVAATAALVVHAGIAPLLLPIRSRSMATIATSLARANAGIPHDPTRTVVLVDPPTDGYAAFLLPLRADTGEPHPWRTYWLATSESPVHVERAGDQALVVRPEGGFYRLAADQMLRDPRRPLASPIALDGLTVRVTAVEPDGRPAVARFDFDRPLGDYDFLAWSDDEGFVPWSPPAVGQAVDLPAADLLRAFFAD